MPTSYDLRFVVLSVVIAVFASYVALELSGRTAAARGRYRRYWLFGGAFALGVGIWSMHYIGMLAFRMAIPISYHLPTVGVSLLAAVGASFESAKCRAESTSRSSRARPRRAASASPVFLRSRPRSPTRCSR